MLFSSCPFPCAVRGLLPTPTGVVPSLCALCFLPSALCPLPSSPEGLSRILEKFRVLVVWELVLIPEAI